MAGMDARIILAGAQPDFVNVLRKSTAGAAEAVSNQRRNALNQLYKEQGAGIVAGNQNALNALAQHSPQAALGVRGAQQDLEAGQLSMDATRQRMDVLNSQERRAVEEHAAKMSAAERAQEAQQIEKGLMQGVQFYQAGDLPRLNALLQSVGEQPLQSLDQFPAVAVKYKGVLDALKSVKDFNEEPKDDTPASFRALEMRAEAAGLKPGTPEHAQFMADGGRKSDGLRVTTDSDGNLTVEQGSAVSAAPPKMTVDAAKNTGFLIRTREANSVLNDLEKQGTRFAQQSLEGVPMGLGNYGRDSEFQRFDQARRDFVNAILRRESGAVISDQEFDNANKQYFPVPGDGPDVIAQKRRNRETAIQGLEVGSGGGAAYLDSQKRADTPKANKETNSPEIQFKTDRQREVFEKYSQP